jgi:DEP domain-containing protein 5
MAEGSGFHPGTNRVVSRRTRKRLILSQSLVIDIDGNKVSISGSRFSSVTKDTLQRSDQAETVILHHDIIHNPATCFHFELQWIGTTARCIEDQLKQWSRTIERYGLKLVEAYVDQICDIREQNPFQSCYPVRLSVPPPTVQDLDKRVPEGTLTHNYFESALLRKFGFVLDIEAASTYPEQIDPIYSYRRAPFKYSQWVHRSGVVFAQVLGGSNGFLFLTNRLIAPGRMGTSLKSKELRPSVLADEVMFKVNDFCSDPAILSDFYEEEIATLAPILEDPPPLKL